MQMNNKVIVLASANPGKLRECQDLLGSAGFDIQAQSAFQVSSVAETGLSFVENAIIKARHACKETSLPAIADDSGLEVDALNGAPGIYSARYAGQQATDTQNNQKLLHELDAIPAAQRSARYQCVLVYMRHEHDPVPIIAQGSWEGEILSAPTGEGGFGYDPLFWLAELNCSAAQLEKADKNRLSHRGVAMKMLLDKILTPA